MSNYEVLLKDFTLVDDTPARRRLVISISGRDKHGKTHLALTAPGPVVYLDFDIGTEGVIEKFQSGEANYGVPKIIIRSKPFVVKPPEVVEGGQDAEKIAEGEWKRFHGSYLRALREPVIKIHGKPHRARTIIVDTGSEMWELVRLAEFGKLVQVPTYKYREVNSIMRDMVRQALDGDVNVIFLHKLDNEWTKGAKDAAGNEKNSKTGVATVKGFDEMAHLVQANIFAYRAPMFDTRPAEWKIKVGLGEADTWTAEPRNAGELGFRSRIINCRHNPQLEGVELCDDMIDFKTLARMIVPGTTAEDWADDL